MQRTFVMAVFAVISSMVTLTGSPTIAQSNSPVLCTQGNPALGDFQTLSNKRVDLRVNISRKGRDAAFSEWLRTERPQLFRDALKQMTTQGQIAAKSFACCVKGASCCSLSSYCCGKSGCASCGTTDCCK